MKTHKSPQFLERAETPARAPVGMVVAGLSGLSAGVSCALTVWMSGRPVDGLWFAGFGVAVGLSCASAALVIFLALRRAKQIEAREV